MFQWKRSTHKHYLVQNMRTLIRQWDPILGPPLNSDVYHQLIFTTCRWHSGPSQYAKPLTIFGHFSYSCFLYFLPSKIFGSILTHVIISLPLNICQSNPSLDSIALYLGISVILSFAIFCPAKYLVQYWHIWSYQSCNKRSQQQANLNFIIKTHFGHFGNTSTLLHFPTDIPSILTLHIQFN